MSTDTHSLRHAFGWSIIQHWGARAISFVIFFILARLLSPLDFGLVALAAIVIGFTEIFIDQGFGDAIVQSLDESDLLLSTAFWVNIITAVVLTTTIFFAANYIAFVFKAPRLAAVTRVLSVTFIFTALSSVQVAVLRRKMDYRTLAMRTTMANLVSGIVACVLAFTGFGVWSLVVQQIVYSIVSTIVVWHTGVFRPSFKVARAPFFQLMHFGVKVCGIRTLDLLHTKLIDSLVGIYLGTIVLGIYSVGAKLAIIILQLLGSSVADVSLSHFSDIYRRNGDISTAYLKMLKRLSFGAVPLFMLLTLNARPLVHLLFGQKWDAATPVFAALCVSGTVQVLIYFSNSVINAVGRPGIQLVLSLTKLALFAGAFFLFKNLGITAIAWSLTGVTILITAPMTLMVLAHLLPFSIRDLLSTLWRPYTCVIVAATIAFCISRKVSPESFWALLLNTSVFVTLFVSILLLLDHEARWMGKRILSKIGYKQTQPPMTPSS